MNACWVCNTFTRCALDTLRFRYGQFEREGPSALVEEATHRLCRSPGASTRFAEPIAARLVAIRPRTRWNTSVTLIRRSTGCYRKRTRGARWSKPTLKASIFLVAVLSFACGARDGFIGRPAASSCAVGGDYHQCVLSDKPVGYWPLDDSLDVAFDISGSNLHGAILFGVTRMQAGLVAGATSYAMAFDNGGVLLPTIEQLAFAADTSLTVELWVASTNTNTQLLFSQQRCTPDTIQMWLQAGYPGFRVATDSVVDVRAEGSTFVADGLAHHLVGVRDIEAAVVRLYVDGNLEIEVTDTNRTTGSLVTYPTDTWLGRRTDCGGENPFYGRLDEVAVYATSLSAERVKKHHAAGVGATAPTTL